MSDCKDLTESEMVFLTFAHAASQLSPPVLFSLRPVLLGSGGGSVAGSDDWL